MKKVKTLKCWGIFQNNDKEVIDYGFKFTVLHPDNMDYAYMCNPSDSDMELDSLEAAIDWVKNY